MGTKLENKKTAITITGVRDAHGDLGWVIKTEHWRLRVPYIGPLSNKVHKNVCTLEV